MHNSITNIFHASRHHYLNIQRFVLRPRGPNIWTKTIIDANLKKMNASVANLKVRV